MHVSAEQDYSRYIANRDTRYRVVGTDCQIALFHLKYLAGLKTLSLSNHQLIQI